MFNIIRSRQLAIFALAAAGVLPACSAEDPTSSGEVVAQTGAERTTTYEEFRATAEWEPRRGMWVVEGDIPLRDEADLRDYYDRTYGSNGALSVNRVNSTDDIWNRTNRMNLTYCVSQASLGANYAATVAAMHQAAAGWEAVANVRFIHVPAHDTNCTSSNSSVVFDVQAWSGSTGQSFFPSWARAQRTLFLNWGASPQWPSDQRDLIAVIMHELGHSLGFRHEHGRTTQCPEPLRAVTEYDTLSIMHAMNGKYLGTTTCPGSTNTTLYAFMSQRDLEGAQMLYEAPTNVVDATIGTVYARKQSDGKFYRKNSSGTWSNISNAANAFVTVGNTLYKLAGNTLQVYSGSGTTWSTVSGAGTVWQIMKCGIGLCATVTDGSIRRLIGSTWATIGGPGQRFISTGQGTIFALDPLGNQVWRYSGSGTSWTNVGSGGFWELFANGGFVYGVTRGRGAVQRYAGSGTSWSNVGGTGRQWLGIDTSLYALTPDGGAVWRFVNNAWTNVGGAAARLYGTNNALFATAPNAQDIYVFNGTSWGSVGKP